MNSTSQRGKIMSYLQKHPKEVVEAKDFQGIFSLKPFVGYSCSARLSELKRAGYIKVVGTRRGLFNSVMRRNKQIYQYKITLKGINLELK